MLAVDNPAGPPGLGTPNGPWLPSEHADHHRRRTRPDRPAPRTPADPGRPRGGRPRAQPRPRRRPRGQRGRGGRARPRARERRRRRASPRRLGRRRVRRRRRTELRRRAQGDRRQERRHSAGRRGGGGRRGALPDDLLDGHRGRRPRQRRRVPGVPAGEEGGRRRPSPTRPRLDDRPPGSAHRRARHRPGPGRRPSAWQRHARGRRRGAGGGARPDQDGRQDLRPAQRRGRDRGSAPEV